MNVFRVSVDGKSIKSKHLEDFVAHETYPFPKIDTSANPPHAGNISLNWNDSTAIGFGITKIAYSFKHGYDYVPTVVATFNFQSSTSSLQRRGTLPLQFGAIGIITMYADDTNIYLAYYSTDISGVTAITPFLMRIRYYVFAERGYR